MNLKITEKQFYKLLSEQFLSIRKGNILTEEELNPPTTSEQIKKFQDWLDINKGNWAFSQKRNQYYKVSQNPNLGYGVFGSNTSKAWKEFGQEYTNSNPQTQVTSKPAEQQKQVTKTPTTQTNSSSQTKVGNTKKLYDPRHFNQNADLIANRLRQHNIPEKSIAAILGNLYIESKFKPTAVGDTKLAGGASVGIAQWREGRRQNLINFAKKSGRDVNDIETQVDFLVHELKTLYKPTWTAVMSPTTSVGDTARIFTTNYERPANASKEAEMRAKIAQEMINAHPDKFKVNQ